MSTARLAWAAYIRTSTDDQQSPEDSRRWQLDIASRLVGSAGGQIVAVYHDIDVTPHRSPSPPPAYAQWWRTPACRHRTSARRTTRPAHLRRDHLRARPRQHRQAHRTTRRTPRDTQPHPARHHPRLRRRHTTRRPNHHPVRTRTMRPGPSHTQLNPGSQGQCRPGLFGFHPEGQRCSRSVRAKDVRQCHRPFPIAPEIRCGEPVLCRPERRGFEMLDTYAQAAPALPPGLNTGSARLRRVRVRIAAAALQLALVADRPEGWRPRPAAAPAPDCEDRLEGSFRFNSYDTAFCELMSLGSEVEVLLPVERSFATPWPASVDASQRSTSINICARQPRQPNATTTRWGTGSAHCRKRRCRPYRERRGADFDATCHPASTQVPRIGTPGHRRRWTDPPDVPAREAAHGNGYCGGAKSGAVSMNTS